MLPPANPLRPQPAHRDEAEWKVDRREREVDAYGRPAILAGEFAEALGEGEGGGRGEGGGGVGGRRVGGEGVGGLERGGGLVGEGAFAGGVYGGSSRRGLGEAPGTREAGGEVGEGEWARGLNVVGLLEVLGLLQVRGAGAAEGGLGETECLLAGKAEGFHCGKDVGSWRPGRGRLWY